MVLEPWITPSLFYQFLGRTSTYKKETPNMIGMDRSSQFHAYISYHIWYMWISYLSFLLLILTPCYVISNQMNTVIVFAPHWVTRKQIDSYVSTGRHGWQRTTSSKIHIYIYIYIYMYTYALISFVILFVVNYQLLIVTIL